MHARSAYTLYCMYVVHVVPFPGMYPEVRTHVLQKKQKKVYNVLHASATRGITCLLIALLSYESMMYKTYST